jgi:diacylglycerol kinase family enzyme
MTPNPERSWQDGLLEVVVVAPKGISGFASVLWRASRRRFSRAEPPLIHFQAREVTIEAEPAMPVQIDGDVAGQTPMTARAVPHGASIFVPA